MRRPGHAVIIMERRALRLLARILGLPESNIVLFAFLLNFVWESWQVPFYRGLPAAPHWEATLVCSLAAVGDAAITLASCWVVATAAGSRAWVLAPSAGRVLAFAAVGVAVTVVAEWVAPEKVLLWAYADWMPTLPLFGTGLLPLLQWTLLPPLVVWLVHRQLG